MRYLVRISRDPESDWGASVPDLPGCVATGKTLDSALRRIEAAITLHLAGLRADGVEPPRPLMTAVSPRRSARGVDFYAVVEVPAGTHPDRSSDRSTARQPTRAATLAPQRASGAGRVRDAGARKPRGAQR
ncbi:MAG: type II toxin-antitoxin system HicB family antitoxin [Candidatus Eisenbacteria bacterium]|uniref:Type II toxin-antitoxin system HicB family antitoxin n=1 Tax=Eiseniibacteriota bacterium TaxID=2212470 RepID=A0A938BR11_UNCEI|nr:type II toxin-antitoxin system HicB family antitoxin [Candidatus Eisenbacteria bacterium]